MPSLCLWAGLVACGAQPALAQDFVPKAGGAGPSRPSPRPTVRPPARSPLEPNPLAKATEAPTGNRSPQGLQREAFLGALKEVLEQHPALKADRSAILAAEEAIRLSYSGFWPSFRAEGEVNQAALWRATGATRLAGRAASLQVDQVIFDDWRLGSRCAAAFAERYALEQDYRANAMAIAANFARAYLGVLRDQAILAAAKRNHQEHQRSLSQIGSVVVNDPGKAFDLEQIRAREAFAASLVTEREAALATSQAQYRELVGHLPGQLERMGRWGGEAFQQLPEALRLAEGQHPSVISARRRWEGRAFLRREAEGAWLPRVDLSGRYVRGLDRSGVSGQNDEAYLGLNASYQFPTGGALWTSVQNLRQLEKAASERVEAARRDLREQLRVLWAQRQGLLNTLPKVREHWQRTKNVMASYRLQYTLGRRTILDLLIIQNEAYQAEARWTQLDFDAQVAEHQLAAAMGVSDLQLPIPSHRPEGPMAMPAWVAEQRYPWVAPWVGETLDPVRHEAESSAARRLARPPSPPTPAQAPSQPRAQAPNPQQAQRP